MQEFHSLTDGGTAAVHIAGLDNPIVFAGRLHHLPPFPDVVRSGLLHEDVLAGLAGPDSGQGVPVVGGGDDDGVDVLVIKDPAHILHGAGYFTTLGFSGLLSPFRDQVQVDVAEGLHLHVLKSREAAHEASALSPDADVGHYEEIVGADDAVTDDRGGAGDHGAAGHNPCGNLPTARQELSP